MIGLLLACSTVSYRDADLVLDVLGPVPDDADTVRVCVTNVGEVSYGARIDGRFAMTALPADQPVDVRVDVLQGDEVVQTAAIDALDGYGVAEPQACEGCAPCQEPDAFASEGEDTWVLAVRFSD